MPFSRPAFLTVVLGLILVLAGLLGAQSIIVARYHRNTAEGVLRDYAGYAADEYARRAEQRLAYQVYPALNALAHVGARGSVPSPERLAVHADSQTRRALGMAQFAFRVALPDSEPHCKGPGAPACVVRNSVGDPSRPSRVATSIPRAAGESSWIADTLTAHSSTVYMPDWYLAIVWGEPATEKPALVYRVAWAPGGNSIVGFATDPQKLAEVLRDPAEKAPLLPPALTGGLKTDSLIALKVRRANGEVVFRSGPPTMSPFVASKAFSPVFGGLTVDIALRPDLAGRLIIGGLPRSRVGTVLTLFSLTAVLLGIALMQLRREQELARTRSDFVSSVSHELRTPLAQLRMFAETLLLGRVRSDQERRRSLEIMDQESRRLTHLVDNLLYFSRAERDAVRVSLEATSLADLATDVADGFRPLAAARSMTVRVDLQDQVTVPADPAALRQVLLNLLDNAVKYGNEGQVIAVQVASVDGRARISVSDSGPGIDPSHRDRIWERFWRLPRDRESAVAGTGIGLAIVKELTAMHGGTCWVEDADGCGSRFVIELPGVDGTVSRT
jgi:signal transduction histidine kinase